MKTISLSFFALIFLVAVLPGHSLGEVEAPIEAVVGKEEVEAEVEKEEVEGGVEKADVDAGVEKAEVDAGVENAVDAGVENAVDAGVEKVVSERQFKHTKIFLSVLEKACTELDPIDVDDVLEKVKEKATSPDLYDAAYEALLLEIDSKFFDLQKETSYLATAIMKNRSARKLVLNYLRRTLTGDVETFFKETGVDPTTVVGVTSIWKKIAEAAFRKGLSTPSYRLDRKYYFKIAKSLRDDERNRTRAQDAGLVTAAVSLTVLIASLFKALHKKKIASKASTPATAAKAN